MIYIYIYNCSHFIVLNSLFTVDLTQALNNCRETTGVRKCRKTWGPEVKKQIQQEKKGEGPSVGGVWRLQHQKKKGRSER